MFAGFGIFGKIDWILAGVYLFNTTMDYDVILNNLAHFLFKYGVFDKQYGVVPSEEYYILSYALPP